MSFGLRIIAINLRFYLLFYSLSTFGIYCGFSILGEHTSVVVDIAIRPGELCATILRGSMLILRLHIATSIFYTVGFLA